MSDRDNERGKYFNKKKFNHRERNDRDRDQKLFSSNKRIFKPDKEGKERDTEGKSKMKQPQILIKPREKIEDHTLSPSKHVKEKEEIIAPKEPSTIDAQLFHSAKRMHKSVKLLDDGILYNDNLQDFMNETSDFLVVGIIGSQGVGKSTIMNLLAAKNIRSQLSRKGSKFDNKHSIFKQQSIEDCESGLHLTNGIDMFITENRMILLDCQPFMSSAVIDELMHNELKRSNLLGDFSTIGEHIGELQGLQHIAFLMCVCHVIIFTQDFILDANNIRFLLTAEMLKPTLTNNEEEFLEQSPHLLILHNKAHLEDFLPGRFKTLQQIYQNVLRTSKMHLESSMGLGNGKIIPSLNSDNCGPAINLFLLPDLEFIDEHGYQGHPPIEQLIQVLKRNISCVTKYPLSHVALTEKTWLSYCTKVWDHVKKSSFYVEYAKILP